MTMTARCAGCHHVREAARMYTGIPGPGMRTCYLCAGEQTEPSTGTCGACGGALWAPHRYLWSGVFMTVCNGCSGDQALMDATAERLRSERGKSKPANSARRHLRSV
jgi:hypothetical protein